VKQLRYAAQTVSNVVTYDAVVLVDNESLKLRPGMTANATFVVDARNAVLTVPNAALRYRPAGVAPSAGRGRKLWVLREGHPSAVPVQLGLSDGSVTEVSGEGLREGALVVTGDGEGAAGSSAQPAPSSTTQSRNGSRAGARMRAPRIL
jgi:HlyD family secretion protein